MDPDLGNLSLLRAGPEPSHSRAMPANTDQPRSSGKTQTPSRNVYKQRQAAKEAGAKWKIAQEERRGFNRRPYREFYFFTLAAAKAYLAGELVGKGTISELGSEALP